MNTAILIDAAIEPALLSLGVLMGCAAGLWLVSLQRHDVSIVDSAWALLQLIATLIYFGSLDAITPRAVVVLGLMGLWSLRLSGYITWRNWGEPEDYRYRQIRTNNQPYFAFKSLYIVFGLQAFLAWLLSLSALAALLNSHTWFWLDSLSVTIFLLGFFFESVGDWQLARFKNDPGNRDRVMRTGLWRFTRHPNYFGEFCMAWGLYGMACSDGGWWTIFAPLLLTALLLKVSGVAMLEKDIGERRPEYRNYIASTNAFFPGLPRSR